MNTLIQFIYSPEEYVDSSGRITALSSFVLGTVLFLLYTIFRNDYIVIIGLLYVGFCVIINTIILLILLFKTIYKLINNQRITPHLVTLGTLVINIPITILYTSIVTENVFHGFEILRL